MFSFALNCILWAVSSAEKVEVRSFASDYPLTDNTNWLRTITYQMRDQEIRISTETPDLKYVSPADAVPYKPPVAKGNPYGGGI